MTPDLEKLAARLTDAQRRAIIRCKTAFGPRGGFIHHRAGDLFPGEGRIMAVQWLRSNPLFQRYMQSGHYAYRLTYIGETMCAHLESRTRGEGEL